MMERKEVYQYRILGTEDLGADWKYLSIGIEPEDLVRLLNQVGQVRLEQWEPTTDGNWEHNMITGYGDVVFMIQRNPLSKIFKTHEESIHTKGDTSIG